MSDIEKISERALAYILGYGTRLCLYRDVPLSVTSVIRTPVAADGPLERSSCTFELATFDPLTAQDSADNLQTSAFLVS